VKSRQSLGEGLYFVAIPKDTGWRNGRVTGTEHSEALPSPLSGTIVPRDLQKARYTVRELYRKVRGIIDNPGMAGMNQTKRVRNDSNTGWEKSGSARSASVRLWPRSSSHDDKFYVLKSGRTKTSPIQTVMGPTARMRGAFPFPDSSRSFATISAVHRPYSILSSISSST